MFERVNIQTHFWIYACRHLYLLAIDMFNVCKQCIPDQTAHPAIFDQDLHCWLRPVDLNTKGKYGILTINFKVTFIHCLT